MTDKIFYKMRMSVDEDGLAVVTEKWHSIHETPCFHYCISDFNIGIYGRIFKNDEGSRLQAAKKRRIKIKRVHKTNSRFAFESKKDAFNNLIYLKKKQLHHLERDIKFIKVFLSKTDCENPLSTLINGEYCSTIPGTKELVWEHYTFD